MGSGFKEGVINLTEPAEVYYSGEVIAGTVVFELKQPLNFSGLYLRFVGEANVLWTDTETEILNGVQRVKNVNYTGHEEYFNFSYPVAGGNGTAQMPAGHNTFNFKYQIPFKAPSSFEGELGKVSYKIIATLMHADASMLKEELEKEFKVVAPFNLREGNPQIRDPVDLEFEEVYGCDCFGGSPMTIRLRLPVSGYCPGQMIPVAIEVQNESSVEIVKMILQIITKERYASQRPESEYIIPAKVIATEKTRPVMGHATRNFTSYLKVPEFIPPYLENCGIIDVGYFLKVTIKLTGCNGDLEDEAEICLGLVPLRETLDGRYQHPMAHSLPKSGIPDPLQPPDLTIAPNPIFQVTPSSVEIPKQNIPVQSNPGNIPYPRYNSPYPYPNEHQGMEMKTIGFATQGPNPYPGQYPGVPPYPTGVAPSAPPPS